MLGHWFASTGDHIRNGRSAEATNSLDRALELIHDYPSLRVNETHDLETQTLPAQISSVLTQTAALESKNTGIWTNYVSIGSTEQQVQTEANDFISQDVQTDDIATHKHYSDTSTDDLFVIGADDSHPDILDWEVASHASSESDASSYSEALVEKSIASARIDEEEEQVLSYSSQQILSKDNSDFYKTVAEIDEMLASTSEEAPHALEANNNNVELQRLQILESEKEKLASSSMELASHSTRNMTSSIISDIDKRLNDASSLSVVHMRQVKEIGMEWLE